MDHVPIPNVGPEPAPADPTSHTPVTAPISPTTALQRLSDVRPLRSPAGLIYPRVGGRDPGTIGLGPAPIDLWEAWLRELDKLAVPDPVDVLRELADGLANAGFQALAEAVLPPATLSDAAPRYFRTAVYLAINNTDVSGTALVVEFADEAAVKAWQEHVDEITGGDDEPLGFRAEWGVALRILTPDEALALIPDEKRQEANGSTFRLVSR